MARTFDFSNLSHLTAPARAVLPHYREVYRDSTENQFPAGPRLARLTFAPLTIDLKFAC